MPMPEELTAQIAVKMDEIETLQAEMKVLEQKIRLLNAPSNENVQDMVTMFKDKPEELRAYLLGLLADLGYDITI